VFYTNEGDTKKEIEAWQSLAHVCRRWRSVVFGSPLRLGLRLFCTAKTRARDTLEVWPPLPLFIQCYGYYPKECVDNIIAALERRNCVYQIKLKDVPSSYFEKVVAAMQEPFPELTDLLLRSDDEMMTDLPDSFLGGSAPRLQSLWLDGIPYPGLSKLLSSATHLVHLNLWNIPHSGYISPEAIVIAVSALTSLTSLWLQFQSPRSRPDRASRRPPPATCTVLPALTSFFFKGVAEYLDDLVARIYAPGLNDLSITFFNQIVFDTPQLIQFVNRTPMLKAQDEACISFENDTASVNLSSQSSDRGGLSVEVSCNALDWQVSSLEQVCRSCLPPFSAFKLKALYIYEHRYLPFPWRLGDDVEDTLWLELLHPFTAVKSLYLSKQFAPHIASALQGVDVGRMADVLPALQNIFLEAHQSWGPAEKGIQKFVAVRQTTGHPISVSYEHAF
jgi:hypothetical protein